MIKAWGFTYRTQAWTWVKLNKSGLGFFTGTGYYTRANTEPCLLAVRGKIEQDPNNPVYILAERGIGYTFRTVG